MHDLCISVCVRVCERACLCVYVVCVCMHEYIGLYYVVGRCSDLVMDSKRCLGTALLS